jgi:hypothetical protein
MKASLRVDTGSRTVTAIATEIAEVVKNKKLGREKEGLSQ